MYNSAKQLRLLKKYGLKNPNTFHQENNGVFLYIIWYNKINKWSVLIVTPWVKLPIYIWRVNFFVMYMIEYDESSI